MKKGKTWVRHILLTMLSCILWLAVGSLASAESNVTLSITGKADYSAAQEVLALVNKERAVAGLRQRLLC